KAKAREEKEESRRAKNEEKAAKRQEKEEIKARKSLDQRQSREVKRETGAVVVGDDDDKLTDGDEPVVAAATTKRSSTLGRIAGRLRRNKKPESAPAATGEQETIPTTTATLGTADAVGSGVVVADVVDSTPADLTTTKVDGATIGGPELGPTLPPVLVSSEEPVDRDVGLLAGRPNLEQHYSHIGYSSGESEADSASIQDAFARADDSKRADELAEKGKRHFGYGDTANVGAATGIVTTGLATVPVIDPAHHVAGDNVDPCIGPAGDPASPSSGLHKTLTANRLDPNLSNDDGATGVRPVDTETITASDVMGRHPDTAATPVVPVVMPDASKPDGLVTGDEIGPASKTLGPHDSNVANIVDPRVKPEPNKLKARERQAEGKSALSNEPTEKESKGLRGLFGMFKKDKSAKEPGKISSGMRSGSASDGKQSTELATTATNSSTTAPSDVVRPTKPELVEAIQTRAPEQPAPHAGHIGTDGPIGDSTHISGVGGEPRAVSPSSFRRRSRELDDLSSVSSSGAEEEDLARGREARGAGAGKLSLMQKLGLTSKGKARETEEDEDEQFEEARDHFDEALAPPPAFAGQAKSASPVRGTRFKEDV
ncbi:Eisosome assembly protein, partial [Teratosphaeriaceae sp. CCFEE 6253]